MKNLTPAERLIVAADFKLRRGEGKAEALKRTQELAHDLKGLGVTIKVHSTLRALGYNLVDNIRSQGMKIFADLKLFDISETLSNDGVLLDECYVDFLTVSCLAGETSLKALKKELQDTEVLGVTVLTSLTERAVNKLFGTTTRVTVSRLAEMAEAAGLDGVVCSAGEAEDLRLTLKPEMTINVAAVRPSWATVSQDDQDPARVMTPADAIKAGADRIIVGRPITQRQNPREAVERILGEIATVL